MGKIEKGYDKEEIRELAEEIKEIHSSISYQFSEILYKAIDSPESLTSEDINRMHGEVERSSLDLTFNGCKIFNCLNSMRGILEKKIIIL